MAPQTVRPQPRTQSPGWRRRPLATLGVRALIVCVPWAIAVVIGVIAAHVLLGPADTVLERVAGVLVGVTMSTVVLVGLERAARRLLPLVMLLRLSLTFPDRAPSRLAIALRAGNLLSSGRTEGTPEQPITAQEQAETLLTLVAALNTHDRRTRGHSERVRAFTDLVAEEMGLAPEDANRLRWAALLHDIGKLEVSATILNKRGALDDDEHAIMSQHPEAGVRLAGPLAEWLGEWGHAIDEHHEKFDGTGYPRQLFRDEISEAGRIVSVTDAFETMTAVRSYKKAMPIREAREELVRASGSHFDPDVVRAFLAISLPHLYRTVGPLAIFTDIPVLTFFSNASARLLQGAATLAAPAVAGAIALVGSPVMPTTSAVTSEPAQVEAGALPPSDASNRDSVIPDVEAPLPHLPANPGGSTSQPSGLLSGLGVVPVVATLQSKLPPIVPALPPIVPALPPVVSPLLPKLFP